MGLGEFKCRIGGSLLLLFRVNTKMLETDQLEEPDFDRMLEMQDFFPKIFLQPREIRLDLEHGIKVIKRDKSHPDRCEEEEVLPILLD